MLEQPQDLHWIRPPRQTRTHQSLERLLATADDALSSERWHGATIARELTTSCLTYLGITHSQSSIQGDRP